MDQDNLGHFGPHVGDLLITTISIPDAVASAAVSGVGRVVNFFGLREERGVITINLLTPHMQTGCINPPQ